MLVTDVVTPTGMEELVAALAGATPKTRLLAGGTDLVRTIRLPGNEPDVLIDLTGLRELSYVRLDGGTLRVGAMTTFTELQADPLVLEHARCLALAAAHVGSVQIRNVGTVGGNVANASPCADAATALVALGAAVTTVDGGGALATRPLGDVLLGPGSTSLAYDEAIVEFSFAALGPEHRSAFVKIGSRSAVSVARLSTAAVLQCDPASGVLAGVSVALGAVGDTAFRDGAVEASLEGAIADEATLERFASACSEAVRRSIPGRYSLPYKERAARGLACDIWSALGFVAPV